MNLSIKSNLSKAIILLFLSNTCLLFSVKAQTKVKVYKLASFGIIPNTGKNYTLLFAEVLKKIKSEINDQEAVVVQFKKGRYDFYPEGAIKRVYYISNHDQDNPKTVGIELEKFKNITFEGNGADLMFHGRMLPVALIES